MSAGAGNGPNGPLRATSHRAGKRLARLGGAAPSAFNPPPPPPPATPAPGAPQRSEPSQRSEPPQRSEHEAQRERPRSLAGDPWTLALGASMLLLAGALIALAAFMLRSPGPRQQTASTPTPQRAEPAPSFTASPPRGAALPERPQPLLDNAGPSDPAGLIRSLRECVTTCATDPELGTDRFGSLVIQLADSWTDFEPATVAECNRLAASALATLHDRDAHAGAWSRIREVSSALRTEDSASAYLLWRNAWGAGFASVVAASGELPAPLRADADALLREMRLADPARPGLAPFDAGASAALRRLAGMIVAGDDGAGGSTEAWKRWTSAVTFIARDDRDHRTRLALAGVEAILASPPAATRDVAWQSAASTLLDLASWGPGSLARREAVRWFEEDSGVSTASLAFLTRWLLSERPEASLTQQMALSPGANPDTRAGVRDQLARLWGLASPAALDRMGAQWREAFSAIISDDDERDLVRAAALARLNLAAALAWAGEPSHAERVMESARTDASSAYAGAGTSSAPSDGKAPPTDGAWALAALTSRGNAGESMRAINELSKSSHALGPIDAEALVEIAFLGSPASVRDSARRLVETHADDPWVINAILEQLPTAPRRLQVGRTVSVVAGAALPPVRDPQWQIEARRALVERLLRTLSGQTELAGADRVAALLADTYADAIAAFGAPSASSTGQRDDPAVPASLLSAELRRQASSMGGATDAAALERRLTGRRVVAVGRIQPFVAEQAGVADALALVTSLERPSVKPQADEALRVLAEDLRAADSVERQIFACERAIAALWALRFGSELES